MAAERRATISSGKKKSAAGWDIFLSHSSKDDNLATRLEQALQKISISVWVDHSDLRRSGLLLSALQEALLKCAHLVLLWSKASEQSRYVTAEWNFAWNREIDIVPCQLDKTLLPLGLAGYLYCDFRTDFDTGFSQLQGAIAQVDKPKFKPATRTIKPAASLKYQQTIKEIFQGQDALLSALGQNRLEMAAQWQVKLDPLLATAVKTYPQDADLLSFAGYQKKNAYMIKFWPQIQARQSSPDALLEEAEKYFWEALQVRPDYSGALNGLGSVLWLRGDLDAAEFYVKRALERAKAEGITYPYAEEDLKNIQLEKRRKQGEKD